MSRRIGLDKDWSFEILICSMTAPFTEIIVDGNVNL